MTPGAITGAAAAVCAGMLISGTGSGSGFGTSTGSGGTGTETSCLPGSSTFFGGSGDWLPPPPPPPPGPGSASQTMSGSVSGSTAW